MMSPQSNYHAMLTRGRKAGLTTRELYSALATRPIEGGEPTAGRADCNGYVSTVNPQGQVEYRPAEEQRS
jgi:hypothetical protein